MNNISSHSDIVSFSPFRTKFDISGQLFNGLDFATNSRLSLLYVNNSN